MTFSTLYSDGHQFHQYQQNEQSPLILSELTEHIKTMTFDLGNSGPGLGQAQKCGGVKQVNGTPTLLSWWLNLQQQYKYKHIEKPAQILFHSKRPHTITKMNVNINMDSTIAGLMNDNINMDSTIAGLIMPVVNRLLTMTV